MKIDRSKIKSIQRLTENTFHDGYIWAYGNSNSSYCYVPIPKNAHNWGKRFFQNYANFNPLPLAEANNPRKRYIVFLRDPIEKWISGITQWFFMNHVGSETYTLDNTMITLLASLVKIDTHTEHQLHFLQGIPPSRCVFFNIDDPLFENNLKYFSHQVLRCRFPKNDLEKLNTAEENSFKKDMIVQLRKALETNDYLKKRVTEYYSKDISFINACKTNKKNSLDGFFYEPF